MGSTKFHIYKGISRTTVTLPAFITDLVALEKGYKPRTPEAYIAVRRQLQGFADQAYKVSKGNFSQWLQEKAVLSLLNLRLASAHKSWKLDGTSRQR